jgi:stage II sporulation protein M
MSKITFTELEGFFKGLYSRNKKFLIASVVLYLLSVFVGVIIAYFLPATTKSLLATLAKTDRDFVRKNGITTFSIFTHNLQSVLLTFAGGIVGIITAIILFINGFIYGSFFGYFAFNQQLSGIFNSLVIASPGIFLIYTLPHGIFEISGFIIAGAGGFRLTFTIYKLITNDKPVSDHYGEFKDAIFLLVIAIILTLIAAIIEANYTIPIGNYITHMSLPIPK